MVAETRVSVIKIALESGTKRYKKKGIAGNRNAISNKHIFVVIPTFCVARKLTIQDARLCKKYTTKKPRSSYPIIFGKLF